MYRNHLAFGGAAAAVLAAVSYVQPAAAADECVIRVAAIVPQTGPLSASAEVRPWIDNLKLDQVNKKGGIKVGGKTCKVQVKFYDSKSTLSGSGEAAETAIVKDKADVILAAFTPDTTAMPSEACEKYEIPCITTSTPIEPWLMGPNGQPREVAYGFHFFFSVPDLVANHIATIKALPGGFNGKIGYLYPSDPDGLIFHSLFAPAFAKEGWQAADPGRMGEGLSDYSAIVAKFKEAQVEAVAGVLPPPGLAAFLAEANKQGFKPKIILVDKATGFASAMASIGKSAEGVMGCDFWSPAYAGHSKYGNYSGQELAAQFEKANPGAYSSPLLGLADASYDILFDALERASDNTPAAIVEALKTTDAGTLAGRIKFNSQHYAVTAIATGQWKLDPQTSRWALETVFTLFPDRIKTNAAQHAYETQ